MNSGITIEECKAENEMLSNSIHAYADEISRDGKEIEDLKFENRKLESKLKNLENDYLCEIDDHAKEVEKLKLINDDLHYTNQLQDEKQAELQDRVNGLEEEATNREEVFAQKYKELKEEIKKLKKEKKCMGCMVYDSADESKELNIFDMSSDDSDDDSVDSYEESLFWEWAYDNYRDDEDIATQEFHPLYKVFELWVEQKNERDDWMEENDEKYKRNEYSRQEFISSVFKDGWWGFELTESHPLLFLYSNYYPKTQ